MCGQPEVIIRSQVDHPLAVKCADRRLLVIQDSKIEVRALVLQFVKLVRQIRERVGTSCGCHDENLEKRCISELGRATADRVAVTSQSNTFASKFAASQPSPSLPPPGFA